MTNINSSLFTLPPELLSQIITHLPSSSLYNLSQTSKPLAKFLHLHAPTICNNLIQSNPLYFRASLILKSTYIDGWLVPQHHAIYDAEDQWRHEVASRDLMRRGGRRGCLQLGRNCCFRSASVGSNSTIEERAPRFVHYTASSSSPVLDHNDPRQPLLAPFSPQRQPMTTTDTHQLPASSSPPLKHLKLSLLQPGPHYLSFLSRYAHDIVTRWSMDLTHTIQPKTPTIVRHANFATQLGPIAELDDLEEEMERMDMAFAKMVGMYCVRGWLSLVEDKFDGEKSRKAIVDEYVGVLEESSGRRLRKRMKEKVKSFATKSRQQIKSTVTIALRCKKTRQVPPPSPKRILFGEIDADSASFSGSSSITVIERDNWAKGLLWYHGVAAQIAIGAEEKRYVTEESEKEQLQEIIDVESAWDMNANEEKYDGAKQMEQQIDVVYEKERVSVRMLRRKWMDKLGLHR